MNTKDAFIEKALFTLNDFPLANHIDCTPSTMGKKGWEKIDLSLYEVIKVNDDVENLIIKIRTSSRTQSPKELDLQFCKTSSTYYLLAMSDSDYSVAEDVESTDMEMLVWARQSDVIYN